MKRALAWFAGNSVAANLLMLSVIVGGLVTMRDVKMEIFPEFSSGLITVTVEYPGAAPEEVEEGICIKIEEEVQDIVGLEKITSTASENVGTVTLEVENSADPDEVLDEVKTRIDAIDTFPVDAEEPIIQEIVTRAQVINVAIAAETDERTLRELGERVRDQILDIPGITQAKLVSARPYEISIEVSEESLRRHGLSFDQVVAAVRQSSIDLPGGSLETRGGDVLLRTEGQAYTGDEFRRLVLIAREDGSRVALGDVADVIDGFRDTEQSARFNGKPAVVVQVFRVGDQNALEVADSVRDYVRDVQSRLPEGVEVTTWQDGSSYLRSRRDLLLKNAFYGLILVFLILTLFLRFKLAFWVSFGISVSFLGAIWLMPTFDVSVNMISLFAFILALGIVVDDAIVVGESIYTRQRRGMSPRRAAIAGVQAVSTPVIFAVFTSIAALMPLLNVSGTTGKIMRVIPLIVIPALVFSLLESLFVLPAHLSHTRPPPENTRNPFARFQQAFARALEIFVDRVFRRHLEWALRWRYLTIALGLATLIITVGVVLGGRVRFTFFPEVDADYVSARLDLPQGAPVEQTRRIVNEIENAALEMAREIEEQTGQKMLKHVLASVGEQPLRTMQAMNAGNLETSYTGGHLGEVAIELELAENRSVTTSELMRRWREKVGVVPEAKVLAFSASIFSAGADVEVELSHGDLETLRQAADDLREQLGSYTGVYNITDSHQAGKMEVKLDIRPEAELLGLTLADLGQQVRQGFYGAEAQRVQRGRNDIRVMVRYPDSQRRSLGDLEDMRVRTPDGTEIPFSVVADARFGEGYATIQRADRRRTVTVTADVDPTRANANEILNTLREKDLPAILERHDGLSYAYEGQRRDQRQTIEELTGGFILALFVIYALLAIPFKSYVQPFIVVSAVPFGFVGAVWGHVLIGEDLTILSMFGLVALTGVVVNDSLVLVDYINRHRDSGQPLLDAVRDAGAARFRPILLTSLTTFGGLTPLLLEKSVQARFLIPMGATLGFGILFATAIILLMVPCMYFVIEDLRRLLRLPDPRENTDDGEPADSVEGDAETRPSTEPESAPEDVDSRPIPSLPG